MEGRTPDYIIIIIYLAGVAVFGIISGGRQRSLKDYFAGSKSVPWWAVCFSIVAAETSALTFISVPGLAYAANLNFLQVAVGYFLGRIVVAYLFLPAYDKGELRTAYTFLENRFGGKTRSFASIVFLFTRTAADGVRLFATAIPLKLMLNINYPLAIIIIAVVSLVYTYTGGMKGIIWVDAVQMFIYIGGAILAGFFLLHILPGGWEAVVNTASAENKFNIFNFGFNKGLSGFFSQPYTLLGGLIGGAFLSMASHGTDQLIVQRLLSARNLKDSQKAVIGSGAIIIVQFTIFLILGIMLFAFYGKMNIKPDEIFPLFIIKILPVGLSGIIIAGLLAAAMSTLSGSISSLASSTMHDIYIPLFGKNLDESSKLKISRIFTLIWAGLLILSAMLFINISRAVVELALSIASFTYGGLLGTFLLGVLNKKIKEREAIIGFTIGILIMIIVVLLKLAAWTWFTLIGVSATLLTGYVLAAMNSRKKTVS